MGHIPLADLRQFLSLHFPHFVRLEFYLSQDPSQTFNTRKIIKENMRRLRAWLLIHQQINTKTSNLLSVPRSWWYASTWVVSVMGGRHQAYFWNKTHTSSVRGLWGHLLQAACILQCRQSLRWHHWILCVPTRTNREIHFIIRKIQKLATQSERRARQQSCYSMLTGLSHPAEKCCENCWCTTLSCKAVNYRNISFVRLHPIFHRYQQFQKQTKWRTWWSWKRKS